MYEDRSGEFVFGSWGLKGWENTSIFVFVPFLFTNSSQTKNADSRTRVIYAVRIGIHCLLIGHFLMCEFFPSGFIVTSLFTFLLISIEVNPWKMNPYTAISRKVVRKSARDNHERYCGWFWIHCFSKKFERMAQKATDVCLRVLKESNKSRFDSYSR